MDENAPSKWSNLPSMERETKTKEKLQGKWNTIGKIKERKMMKVQGRYWMNVITLKTFSLAEVWLNWSTARVCWDRKRKQKRKKKGRMKESREDNWKTGHRKMFSSWKILVMVIHKELQCLVYKKNSKIKKVKWGFNIIHKFRFLSFIIMTFSKKVRTA